MYWNMQAHKEVADALTAIRNVATLYRNKNMLLYVLPGRLTSAVDSQHREQLYVIAFYNLR